MRLRYVAEMKGLLWTATKKKKITKNFHGMKACQRIDVWRTTTSVGLFFLSEFWAGAEKADNKRGEYKARKKKNMSPRFKREKPSWLLSQSWENSSPPPLPPYFSSFENFISSECAPKMELLHNVFPPDSIVKRHFFWGGMNRVKPPWGVRGGHGVQIRSLKAPQYFSPQKLSVWKKKKKKKRKKEWTFSWRLIAKRADS